MDSTHDHFAVIDFRSMPDYFIGMRYVVTLDSCKRRSERLFDCFRNTRFGVRTQVGRLFGMLGREPVQRVYNPIVPNFLTRPVVIPLGVRRQAVSIDTNEGRAGFFAD